MWLDLVALAVLAAFVLVGSLRGALATGLGLLSLVVSYASALTLAPVLGPRLGEYLEIGPLWAVPVAGTGLFLAVYIAMGLISALVRRLARRDEERRGPRDRFLGGVFGAVRGTLIVLLLSWLALWVDALRVTGTVESLPEVGDSVAADLTGEVIQSGIEAAMGEEPAARVMARIASRPGAAIGELQGILENPNIDALRADPLFWTYVEHGNTDAALNRRPFLRLLRDDELRQQLADLGLVPPEAAQDDRAFRDAIAEVLAEVGPRVRGLKNDPEVKQLLQDPQVIAMLQSGDTIGLLGHPGFRSLVDRVTSQPTAN